MEEYYVYLHVDKLTGLVIYCGKGCKRTHANKDGYNRTYDRAYRNDKDRGYELDDTILVLKIKYFYSETEAYEYEEFLTAWYKKCGQCWFNDDIGCRWGVNHSAQQKGTNHPFFGRQHSEESKRKMSEAHKGKTQSEETKQLLSELCSGAKSPTFKGYIASPELNNILGHNFLFEGLRDAVEKCKEIGIKLDPSAIAKVVNGKLKTHGSIKKDDKIIRLTWQRIVK